jgi:hypothetical protein
MLKLILSLFLGVLTLFSNAQGLEDIIVEKFYVSDSHDATASAGGTLPSGSITYRFYVDMAPGYILQSVYADPVRFHDLRFETTTFFFNNEDRGNTTAKAIPYAQLKNNTVMLDSWLTISAVSSGSLGILKTEDTDGAVTNNNGFLQNTDSRAGIPVKTADGMLTGTTPQTSMVGLDQAIAVLDNVNAGPVFSVSDGAWFNAPGVSGPTAENRVLIAQITTDGTLSYRINLQLRRESDFKVENWVYSNPVQQEILCQKCSSLGVPTGIEKTIANNNRVTDNNPSVRLFPNPAAEVLNIELSGLKQGSIYTIAVFDMLGTETIRYIEKPVSINYLGKIDISSLKKGMYIIRIQSQEGFAYVRRFIKNQ